MQTCQNKQITKFHRPPIASMTPAQDSTQWELFAIRGLLSLASIDTTYMNADIPAYIHAYTQACMHTCRACHDVNTRLQIWTGVLHYIILHYIMVQYMTLHSITSHHTTSQCIT